MGLRALQLPLKGARVAVQGFGNAGSIAAQCCMTGAKVIAVSDSTGCIYNRDGLDIPELISSRRSPAAWRDSRTASRSLPAELLALDCDILVPAALENTIHAENADTCARGSWPKPPTVR